MLALGYFTRFVQLLQGELLLELPTLSFQGNAVVTITNMYTVSPQTAPVANTIARRPNRNQLAPAD